MAEMITIGEEIFEYDRQETLNAYLKHVISCSCGYCKNYLQTYQSLPKELLALLGQLGLNPANPTYISEICTNPDGSHSYSIIFDIFGKCNIDDRSITEQLFPGVGFILWREAKVPGHFSGPVIELEFTLSLPWVLERDQ